jgi:hypothetical protein
MAFSRVAPGLVFISCVTGYISDRYVDLKPADLKPVHTYAESGMSTVHKQTISCERDLLLLDLQEGEAS